MKMIIILDGTIEIYELAKCIRPDGDMAVHVKFYVVICCVEITLVTVL